VTRVALVLIASGVIAAPEPEVGGPDTPVESPTAFDLPSPPQTPTPVPEPDPIIREEHSGVAVWHPVAIRDGRLLVIEVEPIAGCPAPKVRFSGRVYDTFEVGLRRHSFVPIRLGLQPGAKPFEVVCGRRTSGFSLQVFAGDYPEARLSVDPKFTSKAPRRAAEESAKISAALASGSADRLWRDTFVRPATGVITSPFGVRRTFNGKLNSRHRGLDFNGNIGDPIVAVNDGLVVLAAKDYYFTGSAVFLAHGGDLYTMYFHMSRLDVATGDKVKRGQVLGAIGASGRVTGPHLHFGFKLAGTYLDPEDLMAYSQTPPAATGR
jgi:hypothetical protein